MMSAILDPRPFAEALAVGYRQDLHSFGKSSREPMSTENSAFGMSA